MDNFQYVYQTIRHFIPILQKITGTYPCLPLYYATLLEESAKKDHLKLRAIVFPILDMFANKVKYVNYISKIKPAFDPNILMFRILVGIAWALAVVLASPQAVIWRVLKHPHRLPEFYQVGRCHVKLDHFFLLHVILQIWCNLTKVRKSCKVWQRTIKLAVVILHADLKIWP